MILFRVSTEGPFYRFLWGPRGVGSGSTAFVVGRTLGSWLDRPFGTDLGTLAILIAIAAGALGLIFGVRTRIATALTLLIFFMLGQRLPELGDGGDNIVQIVLVYMLFLVDGSKEPKPGSLSIWLHNVAVLAIGVQVAILYMTSGMMKAYGPQWHHGIAMYYISRVQTFSLPGFAEAFKNPFIVTVSTYGPMLYQAFFPVAILSRFRLVWLSVGIFFHLGVAFFMGLVSFSAVMIGLDLFLITDQEYLALYAKGGELALGFRALVRRREALTANQRRQAIEVPCAIEPAEID